MAIQQFKAQAQLNKGVQVSVSSRSFNFTLDEPKELGGTDTGMNPVEALLGSLGACQAIVARISAKQFNVVIEDLRIEMEGDLDLDGFLGKAPVRPGYEEIRSNVFLKSPSKQEDIDRLLAHMKQFCPVGDSLANPVKLVMCQQPFK